METVGFNKSGGPITVTVTSGYAQPGGYIIKLKEKTGSKIISKTKGDFNSAPIPFNLPTPASVNDGRRMQIVVTLMINPPTQYSIIVSVSQDGKVLKPIPNEGNSSDNPEMIGVDIELSAEVANEGS